MSKEDWQKNTIEAIFKEANLWPWQTGEIISILDVACGLSLKSKYIPAQIRVGVDIYEKYFDYIESKAPYVVVKYDVRKLKDIFIPNSFDLVLALDIIEHLEKNESLAMLRQCEAIAKRAVIIETPKGYIPQNIDITGYGGDEFQTHRCSWEPEELQELGYQTVLRDYKMNDIQRHTDITVDPDVKLINGIKFIK
ncbi:MAG TPA: class I SAM-dependent methyltransferase [Patescibacteria group bacterium]|nr:class I SAM-dependent methyltransferase [Patescibacteria group bacterium]